MTTDTKALRERLLEWAQNEEMVDQYLTAHGHDCIEAADAIERLEAERGENEEVIRVWRRRCEEAEAREERYRAALAELVGILEIAAVMPEAIHKQMFISWDDPALNAARATLRKSNAPD